MIASNLYAFSDIICLNFSSYVFHDINFVIICLNMRLTHSTWRISFMHKIHHVHNVGIHPKSRMCLHYSNPLNVSMHKIGVNTLDKSENSMSFSASNLSTPNTNGSIHSLIIHYFFSVCIDSIIEWVDTLVLDFAPPRPKWVDPFSSKDNFSSSLYMPSLKIPLWLIFKFPKLPTNLIYSLPFNHSLYSQDKFVFSFQNYIYSSSFYFHYKTYLNHFPKSIIFILIIQIWLIGILQL